MGGREMTVADQELNQLVEEALWFALDKSQSPPSQADTIADALRANPEVVLRALGATTTRIGVPDGKDYWIIPKAGE